MKYMPLTLETAATLTHQKTQIKRYSCDFYKANGHSQSFEIIPIKGERRQKNKHFIQFFFMCYGDAFEIEYKTVDGDLSYKRVIESGQCFLVDQRCQYFSFRVTKVIAGSKPAGLIMKEGTMVVKYERD